MLNSQSFWRPLIWGQMTIPRREILIFLMALATRAIRPGLYFLWIDELNTLNAAADIAYQGVWTWIGNPASWDMLAYHSPFSTYVMTVPLMLSPNPIMARLLVAILGALTSVVMMRMVTHYRDAQAGLIAGMLFAVLPQMVEWGRFVWNPNLAPLFIMLWLFTLLLGYHDGKRPYQIGHWLSLSLCIQSQAVLVMFVPVTILAMIRWHRRNLRWRDGLYTLIAIGLWLLSCIPWGIGLFQHAHQGEHASGLELHWPEWESVGQQIVSVVGNIDFKFYRFADVDQAPVWLPNQLSTGLQSIYTICILVGIIILWRSHKPVGRWWVGLFILPFALFFIDHPYGIAPRYLMPSVLLGLILAAVTLSKVIQINRQLGLLLVALVFTGNLWLAASHLAWFAWMGSAQYSALTRMDSMHEQVEAWHKQAPIVFLQAAPLEWGDTYIPQLEWVMFWKYYEKVGWARLIDAGESIPIAEQGQMIAAQPGHPILSDYFADTRLIRLDERTNITWQYAFVQPNMLPQPQIQPEDGTGVYGLIEVNGLTRTADGLILQWQSFQTSPVETYYFELEWQGNSRTFLSLPSYQWRFGETILTTIDLNLEGVDQIQLRLYRQSDGGYVPVGSAAGTETTITFRLVD